MKKDNKVFEGYESFITLYNKDEYGRWVVYALEHGDGDRFYSWGTSFKEVFNDWQNMGRANHWTGKGKEKQHPYISCYYINEECGEDTLRDIGYEEDDWAEQKSILDNLVFEAECFSNGAFMDNGYDYDVIKMYEKILEMKDYIEQEDVLTGEEQEFLDNDCPSSEEIEKMYKVFNLHEDLCL